MAAGDVKDIDRGFAKIQKQLANLRNTRVRVGIQGPEAEADHGGITNVMVAATHEFGSPQRNIPERSFLRSTFDEKQDRYHRTMKGIAKRKSWDPNELQGEMLLVGERYRSDVIKKMRSSIPPPLKAATVRRKKGETTTLIDTGQLINSIRAVVEVGDKPKGEK